jgi:hypothetical protein
MIPASTGTREFPYLPLHKGVPKLKGSLGGDHVLVQCWGRALSNVFFIVTWTELSGKWGIEIMIKVTKQKKRKEKKKFSFSMH